LGLETARLALRHSEEAEPSGPVSNEAATAVRCWGLGRQQALASEPSPPLYGGA